MSNESFSVFLLMIEAHVMFVLLCNGISITEMKWNKFFTIKYNTAVHQKNEYAVKPYCEQLRRNHCICNTSLQLFTGYFNRNMH